MLVPDEAHAHSRRCFSMLCSSAKAWYLVQVQEAAPEGTDKWHGRVDLATNTASLMLGQNRLRDAVQLYAATSARRARSLWACSHKRRYVTPSAESVCSPEQKCLT